MWILDTYPFKLESGSSLPGSFEEYSVPQILSILRGIEFPEDQRASWLEKKLVGMGLSKSFSSWMTTNVRFDDSKSRLAWKLDLDGISDLYASYIAKDLREDLESPRQGVEQINFVRAEKSKRWTQDIVSKFDSQIFPKSEGRTKLLLLKDSGHWVHQDNPDGLIEMMLPSFKAF